MVGSTESSGLAGLCREDDVEHFIQNILSWGERSWELSSASTDQTPSYEEHTDGQTYQNESEVPICSDLSIAPEDIKSGVRLTDANVFRIRATSHGAKQKEWHKRWPYDFISDGQINPIRRPLGKGVVINVRGMGFYPIFRGYIALCGEQAGRYTSQVGLKKSARNPTYLGFRVGQLLAMPEDLHGNPAVQDLSAFRDNVGEKPWIFFYQPTDRVGLFENGHLTLAPLSAFTGFTPYIDRLHQLRFTSEESTGLTRLEWNWLLEQEGKGELKPSTLRLELERLSVRSRLFKLFRAASPNVNQPSVTDALEEHHDEELPAKQSPNHENSGEDSHTVDGRSTRAKRLVEFAAPTVSATQISSSVLSTASQPHPSSLKYGRARNETKALYRASKHLLGKRKRQKAKEIIKLAGISDEIVAAKELLSTENAAEIIATYKALPSLEAEYEEMSTNIQKCLKPKRKTMGQQFYNQMFRAAKVCDDEQQKLTEKETTDEDRTHLTESLL
ncbi:hypothetical protein N7541_004990 [Penicillium brevicompactum]|uniref:Uncharacterized protein n=1 Tax=Penicillium brevicompactum TaxID=5074 RepID=A0A9W9RCN7_PENBR|nr:hypothetical protein N7541_004990 [Penicillium brevicompactum]